MDRRAAAMSLLLLAGGAAACADDNKPCAAVTAAVTPFHAGKDFIHDASGRVAILRGVNVPGNYDYPFKYTPEDLDRIAAFGFNFIRLGISWRHSEPKEGVYDMAHLERYREFIRAAGERGIHAMIEVHQVNWCMKGGDIPEWMCEEIPQAWEDLGTIVKETDRFWTSEALRAKLIRFWVFLVSSFADLDSLFGYDILNEPTSSYRLVFGAFEKCCLFPFYRDVISAIREVDPHRPIALEPNVLSTALRNYTERFPYDNLVYSPHPYFPHTYGESGLIILQEETPEDIQEKYGRHVEEARTMGVPLLVGEYGGPEENKHDFVPAWLEESHRTQDRLLLGAAYWVYNPDDAMWSIVDRERNPRPYYAGTLAACVGTSGQEDSAGLPPQLEGLAPWTVNPSLVRDAGSWEVRTFCRTIGGDCPDDVRLSRAEWLEDGNVYCGPRTRTRRLRDARGRADTRDGFRRPRSGELASSRQIRRYRRRLHPL